MVSSLRGLALCALVLLGTLAAAAAGAQEARRVQDIIVEGAQRIEPETVRSYLAIAPGDPITSEAIDRSLRNLFATGLFADVTFRREDGTLVVTVVENPIINRIAFEGNRRIPDDALQTEVQLRPRVVYTRTKVQSDVRRVLEIYRRSGRFAATVDPKVIQLPQNRVDLVFEIDEGPETTVHGINIVGNRHYSDSRLREQLVTKEDRWYRFLSADDTYDPDRLTYDRELLRRFYLKNGYADFRVTSVVAELAPARDSFVITFTIEEGERYRFGKVDLRTTLPDLDVNVLWPLVGTVPGDWYDAEQVEEAVQRLTSTIGNFGYAFVDVRPRVERNREERTVELVYEIEEGPRVFVEQIEIQGNVRTLDKVIRREFRLVEGDAFNAAKLRRSRQRIRDLGFFEKVEISNVPSEAAPDRTVIKVDVEEKSTGEMSFGLGFSTSSGGLIDISVRERNLLGRGQALRLGATLAQRRTQLDFSFTEPYFLDRAVSAGIDLYAIERDLEDESSYDATSLGGSLRLGYQITEHLRQDLRYTLRQDEVTNVAATASLFVQAQQGQSILSSVGQTLTYDRRNSRLEPTEGWFVRLNNELAGFGGTERFLRTNLATGEYFTLAEQVILGLTWTGGYIWGIGEDVRITERYFVGGDNLRGFTSAGVSPRDRATADALGGIWMYAASAQVNFPLGLPEELGLRGHAFTDLGSIGPTDENGGSAIREATTPRLSVGVGVAWRSPMGPINLDLAFPILKEGFDETEMFRFDFGTRF